MAELADIYEAAGFKVTEDGQNIIVGYGVLAKPFDIIVRVIPASVSYEHDQEMRITFEVVLDSESVVEEPEFGEEWKGPRIRQIKHFDTVTIPISQVRIADNDKS